MMIDNDILKFIDNIQFRDFMFDNATDVYWILDSNKSIVFISSSIYELTGYTPEEYLSLEFNKRFTERSVIKLTALFDNLNNTNQFKNIILEYLSKNEEVISTEISGIVIRGNEGELKGLYGLTANKSDKYKLQRELLAEKDKSSEAEKFQSMILGIMGHEFRTPLSGILGFTKLLSKNSSSSDDAEALNYIYQSAHRLNATLNSIITLAALETNQIVIIEEHIDILEMVHNIYRAFEPLIINKNISLDVNVKIQNSSIKFDENCLYQILYHLIDNAVKFTEKGRIFIDFQLFENTESKILEIKVQDTGIGIKKQQYNTIFEPFRQLSEGHSRKFEGLGIGLTITKKIIEKLKGTIQVKSKLNEGSIFIINLPYKGGSQQVEQLAGELLAENKKSKKTIRRF